MKRRSLLVLFAGLAVTALACSKAAEQPTTNPKELAKLTVDEVDARIAANDGHTFIYDNNSRERWAKGHVPGAKWLDEESITAADLPADKDATLIFYCHNEH